MEKILAQGAEATILKKEDLLHKIRVPKSYRLCALDEKIRKSRTRKEAKALRKAAELGIAVPKLYETPDAYTLVMEHIDGPRLRDVATSSHQTILEYFQEVGTQLAQLHEAGLIHGDLTTSNILIADQVYFIDFGLSFFSDKIEDKAVDLHVLEEALESTHHQHATLYFEAFLKGYQTHSQHHKILKRLEIVKGRGRYKKS